jgi:hypothetical protein
VTVTGELALREATFELVTAGPTVTPILRGCPDSRAGFPCLDLNPMFAIEEKHSPPSLVPAPTRI